MVTAAVQSLATSGAVWSLNGVEYVASLVTIFASISGLLVYMMKGRRDQNRRDAEARERDERFQRDWYGEEARPGVPRRPGVLEQLQIITGEVTYNHGGSLKDGVRAISNRLEDVESDVKGIHERMDKQVSP